MQTQYHYNSGVRIATMYFGDVWIVHVDCVIVTTVSILVVCWKCERIPHVNCDLCTVSLHQHNTPISNHFQVATCSYILIYHKLNCMNTLQKRVKASTITTRDEQQQTCVSLTILLSFKVNWSIIFLVHKVNITISITHSYCICSNFRKSQQLGILKTRFSKTTQGSACCHCYLVILKL